MRANTIKIVLTNIVAILKFQNDILKNNEFITLSLPIGHSHYIFY